MWILSPYHPHLFICTSDIQHKLTSAPAANNLAQSTICLPFNTITTTSRDRGDIKRDVRGFASWPDQLFKPDSLEMEPIQDSHHFDQILEAANQLSQPILVDWMAAWCRKCIYLKPKLEKLAVEYDAKIKFYCVDVNNVPQALVKRGNISIWKDGEMKAEVIGGHKAWLVVEEVRQMIQQFV